MATPQQTQGPQPSEQLMQFATGYMVSAALYAVTQLGIPDLLKHGPKSVHELAGACAANEDAVYRALRALASVGVLTESSPRTFALTTVGDFLRSDREDSARDMVLWLANKFHYQTYPEMLHSLKTGETVVEKVFGESCFGYFEKDKEVGDVFNAAMTTFSKMLTPAVLDAYDFSWLNGKTLVDVGGGHGYLLTTILKKYPEVRGVVFDLDHVVAGAPPNIATAGLAARCHAAAGDFFADVPPGDAYMMKNIIHDWSDEKALSILRNCHRAGKANAKVILIEAVITPGDEPHFAKWLDLEMLLLPGGRERTEEEFAQLFERAGFKLTRVVPTKSPVCVLEAEKRN
jgi:hypothetical protein